MATKCCQCKKDCPKGEKWFAIYKCTKGENHVFHSCKLECLKAFERRCEKVAEVFEHLQKKFNNDGGADFRRRLPPNQRDKFKSYRDAEADGLFICPEDEKCAANQVPHCAALLSMENCVFKEMMAQPTKAEKTPKVVQKEAVEAEAVPASDAGDGQQPEKVARDSSSDLPPRELVSEELLEVLVRKKEDQEEDTLMMGAKRDKEPKKKEKGQKQGKKGKVLSPLDWALPTRDEEYDEGISTTSSTPPHASTTPGPPRMGSAWGSLGISPLHRETEREAKVQRLRQVVPGVPEVRLAEVLEAAQWDLEKAICQLVPGPEAEAKTPVAGEVRWGPRQALAVPAELPPASPEGTRRPPVPAVPAALPPTPAVAEVQQVPRSPPPAEEPPTSPTAAVSPSRRQPPPERPPAAPTNLPPARGQFVEQTAATPQSPVQAQVEEQENQSPHIRVGYQPEDMPEGWTLLYSRPDNRYYGWHEATNQIAWEIPDYVMPAPPQPNAPPAQALPPPPTEQELICQVANTTGLAPVAAKRLLEDHHWSVGQAVATWKAEQQRLREEHLARERAAAEEAAREARRKQEEQERAIQEAARQAAAARAAEEARAREAIMRAGFAEPGSLAGKVLVCTKHYRPDPMPEHDIMPMDHGDHLHVDKEYPGGWVYGSNIYHGKKGFVFIKDAFMATNNLCRVARSEPAVRVAHETYKCTEAFVPPPHLGGYLTVNVGDTVRILHVGEPHFIWLYGEHESGDSITQGWIPSCVLEEQAS